MEASGNKDETLVETESPTFLRRRYIRTGATCVLFVFLGLTYGVDYVAIPDLLQLLSCSVSQLSASLMFKSIGMLLGSVGAGVLVDHYRPLADLALAVTAVMLGALTIVLPWSPNLAVLGVLGFLQGWFQGLLSTAGSAITVTQWAEKCAVPYNLLLAFSPVGVMTAPLIAASFLSETPDRLNQTVTETADMSTTTDVSAPIRVPYSIIGFIGIVVAPLFISFYVRKWDFKLPVRDETTSGKRFWQRLKLPDRRTALLTLAIFVVFITTCTRDRSLGTFQVTIAIQPPLNQSKEMAAYCNTLYSAMLIVSRVIGTVLAGVIPVHWILFVGLGLTVIIHVCMILFSLSSIMTFWLLACAVPLVVGPFYATFVSWVNEYVEVGGKMLAVMELAFGFGAFVSMGLSGYLFDTFGPQALFVVYLICSICVLVVMVPLQVYFTHRARQYEGYDSLKPESPNCAMKTPALLRRLSTL